MKKRYAIVRVDNTWCPNAFDNISMEFICSNKTNIKSEENCKNCRYGDTKEQLEKKIITAIERAGIDYVQLSKEEIATEIVEFLGVE